MPPSTQTPWYKRGARNIRAWGITPEEEKVSYPCDNFLPDSDDILQRGIDIHAPVSTVFRWLCQLKVAPYSYDLIDNFGKRSCRKLIPGLERLVIGQKVMTIFELVAFEENYHLTLMLHSPRSKMILGSIALTYLVQPMIPMALLHCRLLARIRIKYPTGLCSCTRYFLPLGDLLMMRKQFLTIKYLAEQFTANTNKRNGTLFNLS